MPDPPPGAAPTPATPISHLGGWHIRCLCTCGRNAAYSLQELAGVHGPKLRLWRLAARLRCRECGRPPLRVSLLSGIEEAGTPRQVRELVILEAPSGEG